MAILALLPSTSNAIYNNKPSIRSLSNNLSSTQPSFSFTISKHTSLPVLGSTYDKSKRKYIVCDGGQQPEDPLTSVPPPSNKSAKGWIVGIFLTVLLPSFRHKWGPLMQLKNEVDTVVETVEDIADGVEKVAEVIDKMAEDIAEDLPEGQLKEAAKAVEKVAEKMDKSAEKLGDLIDKAQELEDIVEERLESVAKSKNDEASKPVKKAA